MSRKNGRPTFRLSFNHSGEGFAPACREMSELMIEQPDGTLSPCTGANAPSSALSVELDDRTRAALDGSVMDGVFSAFDAQDPLSQLTQVADAETNDQSTKSENKAVLAPEGDWAENFIFRGNHKYTHLSAPVCRAGEEGCTLADVVKVVNERGVHPEQTRPFVPGKKYIADVDIWGPWKEDSIEVTAIYDAEGNQIGVRNEALEDHILHPGIVQRTVVLRDGHYHIFTEGGGWGYLGKPNVVLNDPVWWFIDREVIGQFED